MITCDPYWTLFGAGPPQHSQNGTHSQLGVQRQNNQCLICVHSHQGDIRQQQKYFLSLYLISKLHQLTYLQDNEQAV